MKTHATQLEAKIAARNQVHALALEKLPAMYAALAPFVGQRIILATGLLSARIKAALPPCESTVERHFYYSTGAGYSLTANFRTSTTYGDGFAVYADCVCYLGDLTNGDLVKLYDPPTLRTDYTAAEIQQVRANVRTAQAHLSEARKGLGEFGEYDN